MLTSIIVMYLLLGGSSTFITTIGEDLDKKISATIENKEQQKEVLDIVKDARELLQEYEERGVTLIEEGQILNSNYDAKTEDLDLWISSVVNERKEYIEKLEDIHFKLVGSMSKEEWEMIVNPVD
jgi:hypothetical protein